MGRVGLACSVGFASAAAQDRRGVKIHASKSSVTERRGHRRVPSTAWFEIPSAEIHEWIVDPAGMTAKHKAARKPAMPAVRVAPEGGSRRPRRVLSSLKK
jgi:hypothetical protein